MNRKLSTGKLSNAELIAIDRGIAFLRLEHRSEWGIADGQKHLKVRFAYPVLKRPICNQVADFCLAWAKHHPRFWVVEVTAHYQDGDLHYDETVEIESPEPVKLNWLTEAVKSAESDVKAAGNPKHLTGVSWRARIKTKAERGKSNA